MLLMHSLVSRFPPDLEFGAIGTCSGKLYSAFSGGFATTPQDLPV
jgi:hypothetical protein